MRLANKVAVITGASRGIGRAFAFGFDREGALLALASRSPEEMAVGRLELQQAGIRVTVVETDVSDPSQVRCLVEKTLEAFGQIDVLINNAGIQHPIGAFAKSEIGEWMRALQVNLFGSMLCMRAILPHMIERRRGKIINLSGGGATAPRPYFSAYAASKAAIVRLTETVAEEVKPYNIQVNAIAPGAINTRMLDEVLAAGHAAGKDALAQAEKQKETGGNSIEEVVALAVFLASDESGTLTGKLISAQHDPWREWAGKGDELNASPLYTLRRLDPHTLKPLLKDLK